MTQLNIDRIVHDARKCRWPAYPSGYLPAGLVCLLLAAITAVGILFVDGKAMTLLNLRLPILLLLAGARCFVLQWKVKKNWFCRLAAGEFHLVQNPVSKIVDKLDNDLHPDRSIRFLYHDVHGRYEVTCNKKDVLPLKEGEQCYLVLSKNAKGKLKVLNYYPVETTGLDETLSQALCRDKGLTGYDLSVEDELKKLIG